MSGALVLSGWLAAAGLAAWVVVLRRRLDLVALADHELRAPVGVLALAAEALRRRTGTRTAGLLIEGQVERLRIALADLAAARRGGRASGVPVALRIEDAGRAIAAGFAALAREGGRRLRGDWAAAAGVARIDKGRFAQALGNVLANAVEHGDGDIAVATARGERSVRVEVRDEGPPAGPPRMPRGDAGSRDRRPGRGNGLAIARRAVEEAGGSLTVAIGGDGTTVTIELPLADAAADPPAAGER